MIDSSMPFRSGDDVPHDRAADADASGRPEEPVRTSGDEERALRRLPSGGIMHGSLSVRPPGG